jgi:hypothetical protein
VLPKTDQCATCSSFDELCSQRQIIQRANRKKRGRTLEEERQEGNEEHQEDGNDTTPNPVEHGDKVVAPWLPGNDVASSVQAADGQCLVESSNEHH